MLLFGMQPFLRLAKVQPCVFSHMFKSQDKLTADKHKFVNFTVIKPSRKKIFTVLLRYRNQ